MIRESIQGRAWKVGSNVSTDSIAPGRLISLRANPKEYAKHVLEDARPDFAPNVKKDDILVADRNFGCGSSREIAPIIIKEAGVGAVLAKSFGRIFYRNLTPACESGDEYQAFVDRKTDLFNSLKDYLLAGEK